ncbi:hypothetical protein LXA43DRAFT_990444 [Ganoderma leucocontextum]|nr:hypothetical protein LXA43DRAFT_990444 [Ganoderma leucocontextum]
MTMLSDGPLSLWLVLAVATLGGFPVLIIRCSENGILTSFLSMHYLAVLPSPSHLHKFYRSHTTLPLRNVSPSKSLVPSTIIDDPRRTHALTARDKHLAPVAQLRQCIDLLRAHPGSPSGADDPGPPFSCLEAGNPSHNFWRPTKSTDRGYRPIWPDRQSSDLKHDRAPLARLERAPRPRRVAGDVLTLHEHCQIRYRHVAGAISCRDSRCVYDRNNAPHLAHIHHDPHAHSTGAGNGLLQ